MTCGVKSGLLLLGFLLLFSVCSLSAQDVETLTDAEIIEQLLQNLEERESLLLEKESLLRTRDAILTERESILESRENSLVEREQWTQDLQASLTKTENSFKSYVAATNNTITLLRLGLITVGAVAVIESIILGLKALAP